MPSSTTPSVWKLLGLDLQNEEHMPMSEQKALDFINDIDNVITEMQNQLVTNLASYKI